MVESKTEPETLALRLSGRRLKLLDWVISLQTQQLMTRYMGMAKPVTSVIPPSELETTGAALIITVVISDLLLRNSLVRSRNLDFPSRSII